MSKELTDWETWITKEERIAQARAKKMRFWFFISLCLLAFWIGGLMAAFGGVK
jgi:hypothetical protein